MLDAAAFHSGKWRTAILTEKGNPGPCGSAHEWVVSCIRITRVPAAQVWECRHCHGYKVKVPEDCGVGLDEIIRDVEAAWEGEGC